MVAAIYTHYRSKCQEHSIRSKGIYDQRIKERRHCERLNRVCVIYLAKTIQYK